MKPTGCAALRPICDAAPISFAGRHLDHHGNGLPSDLNVELRDLTLASPLAFTGFIIELERLRSYIDSDGNEPR